MQLPSNRAFASLFLVVLGALSAWHFWHGRPGAGWLWFSLAAVLGLVALIAPGCLTPLNRAWMRLGLLLNRVMSPLVLGVMYAVLIVPVGLVVKLFGRDVLRLKSNPTASSHWRIREQAVIRREDFKNQF